MIHAHAAAARNTNSVAADCSNRPFANIYKKVGDRMVDLDRYKYTLSTYQKPLLEVRDSL